MKIYEVCELSPDQILRVVSFDGHTFHYETTTKIGRNLITCNVQTCTISRVRELEKRAPGRVVGISGLRYVTIKNKKPKNQLPSSTVYWQDDICSPIFNFEFPEREVHMARLSNANCVLIGSRVNGAVGDGALSCANNDRMLWSFAPTETEEYPSWKSGLKAFSQVKAFPYYISSSEDAALSAFCFLRHYYLLNVEGKLIRHFTSNDLIDSCVEDAPEILAKITNRDSILVDDAEIQVQTEISYDSAQYAFRTIDSIAVSSKGTFCLAAIKNLLVWLTPTGRIAHHQLLPLGEFSEIGDSSSIIGMRISTTENIVIAAVCCKGFIVIIDGKVCRSIPFEIKSGHQWDFSDEHQVIVVYMTGMPNIFVYGFDGNLKATYVADSGVTRLEMLVWDDLFLLVCAGRNMLLKID